MLTNQLRPAITLSETDHRQLLVLALSGSDHSPEAGDDLFYELDRARVLPEPKMPADVVRMGSFVTYRADDGEEREVELVYPGRADIDAGRISILTPIGTALIGLRVGQSISWSNRTGRRRTLTALAVRQPASA